MPQHSYAPSISSHVSHGSKRRLPNIQHTGYEHSNVQEFPNPATSSRLILPLEPDFSQMSDPRVRIEPPNTLDQQSNYTSRLLRKEQSKRSHKSKKRKRHRSSSSSSTSKSSSSDSFRRSKKSKRSRHSQRQRRRRSMTPSSSSHTLQSDNDFGRYKRVRVSPQVAEAPVPMQPAEPININPDNIQPVNIQPVNTGQDVSKNLTQTNKDSDSDNKTENWSFDRAINKDFWFLPEELCPNTQQEHTPAKPLSGL